MYALRHFGQSVVKSLIAGALFVIPLYLALLLLLKAMKSLHGVVWPLAKLLPRSIPAGNVLSLLLVLVICLLIGIILRTPVGQATLTRIDNTVLHKIPGYEAIRSVTGQLTGQSQGRAWQPALIEIENALVPGFIVEELDDGRFTVFVPSVPTPMAGAIYILNAERVHPLNVPFTQAIQTIARWGSGSKQLVQAMQQTNDHPAPARQVLY
jgi:uncharacterized membrane protein